MSGLSQRRSPDFFGFRPNEEPLATGSVVFLSAYCRAFRHSVHSACDWSWGVYEHIFGIRPRETLTFLFDYRYSDLSLCLRR